MAEELTSLALIHEYHFLLSRVPYSRLRMRAERFLFLCGVYFRFLRAHFREMLDSFRCGS